MRTVIQHCQTQATLFLPGLVQLNFARVITQAAGHWPTAPWSPHCHMVSAQRGVVNTWPAGLLYAPPCSLVCQLIIYTHINLSDTLKVLFD